MNLVSVVYKATAAFPQDEKYGLTAQLRRAAVSVPSNIAEGAARESAKEFGQFLIMARGSLSELETQLQIAKSLGYITEERLRALQEPLDAVFALIGGLLRSIRQRSAT